MTPSPSHHQPASLRASLFLALQLWLGFSAFALAAAAVIVFGL